MENSGPVVTQMPLAIICELAFTPSSTLSSGFKKAQLWISRIPNCQSFTTSYIQLAKLSAKIHAGSLRRNKTLRREWWARKEKSHRKHRCPSIGRSFSVILQRTCWWYSYYQHFLRVEFYNDLQGKNRVYGVLLIQSLIPCQNWHLIDAFSQYWYNLMEQDGKQGLFDFFFFFTNTEIELQTFVWVMAIVASKSLF